MQTLTITKTDIVKQYQNFIYDLNLTNTTKNISNFVDAFIYHQIEFYGIFKNKNFKTTNIEEIKKELTEVLKNGK